MGVHTRPRTKTLPRVELGPPLPQRKPASHRHRLQKPEPVKKIPAKKTVKPKEKEAKPVPKEKAVEKSLVELETKAAQLQSVEASEDGHYELNPLMSRALESELQQIMIKVWQELPDTPPTEAEKMVADKFRTQAGDDLKNALGLNVTKRILNIFNPIYVKVELDQKPAGAWLQSFVRWLNCAGMRRAQGGAYLARLRTAADLDRATRRRHVSVGGLKARITPYYKFTTCPPNLKTVYQICDVENTEKSEQKKISEGDKNVQNVDVNVKSAAAPDVKPNNKKSETVPTTDKPVQLAKPENTKPVATETAKKVENKSEANKKPAVAIPKQKLNATQSAPAKSQATPKQDTNVIKTAPSKSQVTPKKDINVDKTTPAKSQAIPKKDNNVIKTTPAKTEPAPKKAPTVSKITSTKNETAPKKTVNSAQTKPSNKVTKVTETKTVQVTNAKKSIHKSSAKKVVPAKVTHNKTKSKKQSDFDELNDEDILALMSDAIVLDECMGSDEDQ